MEMKIDRGFFLEMHGALVEAEDFIKRREGSIELRDRLSSVIDKSIKIMAELPIAEHYSLLREGQR